MVVKNQAKPGGVLQKPYWSFVEIIDLALHRRFFDACNSEDAEVAEFRANLLGDLRKAILCKAIVPVDLSKSDRWFDRYEFYIEPVRKFALLLGVIALVSWGQELLNNLSSYEKAIFFKPGYDGANFFINVLFGFLKNCVLLLSGVWLIFLCYMAILKFQSKTTRGKLKYLLTDAKLRGFMEGFYESETVIDFLNSRYSLKIEKDPFRIWKEPFLRRNGDYWIVGYMGKRVCLKNQKIIETIAYLLSSPEKSFNCSDFTKVNPENINDEKSVPDHDGDVMDYKKNKNEMIQNKVDRKKAKEILEMLEADMVNARESGDADKLSSLQDNVIHLKQYIRETFSRDGNEKAPRDQAEKSRDSQKKAIERFIKGLKNDHPFLAEHLRKSIERGYNLVYRPPEEIHWDIRFD